MIRKLFFYPKLPPCYPSPTPDFPSSCPRGGNGWGFAQIQLNYVDWHHAAAYIMPIGRMPWVTMPMRSTCTPNWLTAKEHLQDNLRTFSPLVPLDGEGREFLDNVAERMIDSQSMPCMDCKYCMPWSVWDRYSVHSPVRWYGIAYIQGLVFLDMPGLGRIEESASFADAGIRTGAAFVCQFRL